MTCDKATISTPQTSAYTVGAAWVVHLHERLHISPLTHCTSILIHLARNSINFASQVGELLRSQIAVRQTSRTTRQSPRTTSRVTNEDIGQVHASRWNIVKLDLCWILLESVFTSLRCKIRYLLPGSGLEAVTVTPVMSA